MSRRKELTPEQRKAAEEYWAKLDSWTAADGERLRLNRARVAGRRPPSDVKNRPGENTGAAQPEQNKLTGRNPGRTSEG